MVFLGPHLCCVPHDFLIYDGPIAKAQRGAVCGQRLAITLQVLASSRLSILTLKGTSAITPVRMTCFFPDKSME